MKKKYIEKFGAEMPLLAFGCMRLPKKDDKIDFDEARRMIHRAIEGGVNYFDTAYGYHNGESETFLGKVLPEFPRDSYYLTSKLPIWLVEKEGDAERLFNEQLSKCKAEYFDFYHLHAMNKSRVEIMEKFKLHDFISKKKAEGKVKHIGFSFHDKPEVLEEIVSLHDWDFAQLQVNYWDWTEDEAEAKYEILKKAGIPCFIMEPVRGGFLASFAEKAAKPMKEYAPDESLASWAIRWAATLPNTAAVLSGMSTMEQLEDNMRTLSDFHPITAEEQSVIDETIKELRKINPIPCTGCRYCMECPYGVDIPEIFSIYNDYKKTENIDLAKRSYSFLEDKAKAQSCQKCQACVSKCPQHISIPEELEKIGAELN